MSIFFNFKPISTALLPNAESDDVELAIKSFLPWNWNRWKNGKEIGELENKFSQYLGVRQAISFSSGRVGLYAILMSLSQLKTTDHRLKTEILLQAYTTIALPLAIKQAGFTPVYVDIKEDTFNIDAAKIEAKITANTKAIIVQHTFGIPAEMDRIIAICKKHNLFLIEDCAHSLGAEFSEKKIGTFGDAAFFSFGRDKIISSTSGGMVIAKNEELAGKIREFQGSLDFPSAKWIFQQLMHPIVFWFSLPIYYFFNIGKLRIFLNQKLGIISRAYSREEKDGRGSLPARLAKAMAKRAGRQVRGGNTLQGRFPNILAILALNQFKKIERFNNHRRKIAEIYQNSFCLSGFFKLRNYSSVILNVAKRSEESRAIKDNSAIPRDPSASPQDDIFGSSVIKSNLDNQSEIKLPEVPENSKPTFLYYTIQVDRRDELLNLAARNHIILGDWFPGALGPKGVDEKKFGYQKGDCPIAERVGAKSLNLPTNIKTSETDAGKVVGVIKEFINYVGSKNATN